MLFFQKNYFRKHFLDTGRREKICGNEPDERKTTAKPKWNRAETKDDWNIAPSISIRQHPKKNVEIDVDYGFDRYKINPVMVR